MRTTASFIAVTAFVALLHCGSDEPTPIECKIAPQGKTCECTLGREPLGFCSEAVLGIPSVCCAQDGFPAAGLKCDCDLVVCVSIPSANVCKCSRATTRITGGADAIEVAECQLKTGDTTRCCRDKEGNCGCYLRTNDQCGEGATEVEKCDYFQPQLPCPAGKHTTTTCER